jgi:hypothetical protein
VLAGGAGRARRENGGPVGYTSGQG